MTNAAHFGSPERVEVGRILYICIVHFVLLLAQGVHAAHMPHAPLPMVVLVVVFACMLSVAVRWVGAGGGACKADSRFFETGVVLIFAHLSDTTHSMPNRGATKLPTTQTFEYMSSLAHICNAAVHLLNIPTLL